jgi:hypothetical protein
MKKHYFLSIICFSFLTIVNAQQINWMKEHPLKGSGYHWGISLCTDNNDNIYYSSIHRGTAEDGTLSGSFIQKYDKNGILVWRNFIPRTQIRSVVSYKKDHIYISGEFQYDVNFGCGLLSDSAQLWTLFIAKLDTSGNCIWSKMVPKADLGKMTIDDQGKLYVVGTIYHPTQFDNFILENKIHRHYIAKLDNNGNFEWVNTVLAGFYPSGIASNDKFVAVIGKMWNDAYFGIDSASYLLGGPDNTLKNNYTALYDLGGKLLWAKQTVSNGYETNSITINKENNIYVTGFMGGSKIEGREFTDNATHDAFVVKYNEHGDTLFVSAILGSNFEEGRALYAAEDGIYWSGTFYNKLTILDTTIYTGCSSFFIAKMDFDFKKIIWVKTFNGASHSEIFQMTTDSEGNLIACGDYTGHLKVDDITLEQNTTKTPFVMSINPKKKTTTSIIENTTGSIFNVFPNPAKNSFTVHYHSEPSGLIYLKVRTLSGAVIYNSSEQKLTGTFQKEINISNNVPGIYFLELLTDKERLVRKVIISR